MGLTIFVHATKSLRGLQIVDGIVEPSYLYAMTEQKDRNMSKGPWINLRKAFDLANEIGEQKVAEKVDLHLNAAMETISEKLSVAPADVLSEGSRLAKSVLDNLSRANEVDRLSINYLAGRLAAASDVLGYAARQTADEDLLKVARMQPYATILSTLYQKPLRNTDLVKALGKDKAHVSRALDILRSKDAVVSHREGRELYNALTPVGRAVVDAGIQDARRAPLASSSVHCLAAEAPVPEFDLRSREAPLDLPSGVIPTLRASY